MKRREVKVLALVLAGGEGKRLAPLTRSMAKPAVPFHASHRLIDFALSNLRNSGVQSIHVLMQYEPDSVLQHLRSAWQMNRADPVCSIHPTVGGQAGVPRFGGTADAVYQIRHRIEDDMPDLVAVFSADHIYRMDVRQMIDFHLQSGADATVAALPVPLAEACFFGVMETRQGGRIMKFSEKPQNPAPMPGRPDHALASMGNYLFSPGVLLEALAATHAAGGTDFGGDLLPSLIRSHRLMAYDFTTNLIPGLPEDADRPYWRDVGTIDSYFAAHMDTVADHGLIPRFNVNARAWPIGGALTAFDPACSDWSLGRHHGVAGAAPFADIESSILRRDARVGAAARISRCILGDGCEVGPRCRLRNVIVEGGARIPAGFVAGFDTESDRKILPVSDSGIVVIPRDFSYEAVRPVLVHAAPAAMPQTVGRAAVQAATVSAERFQAGISQAASVASA